MTIDRDGLRDARLRAARGAGVSGSALVTGNRAGVVDWASQGWEELAGCSLDDSVGKPIFDFVRRVDAKPELVDFVGRCFRAGRPCEIEVPHTVPGGMERWIRLRVEPGFDADGEVSDFVAIATDCGPDPSLESGLLELDLSELAARSARRLLGRLGDGTLYDGSLAPDLPLVLAEPAPLEGLVERLICRATEAIGDAWGTLTISTGVLGHGPQPLFRGPLLPAGARRLRVFLEVHDTGSAAPSVGRRELSEPFLSTHHSEDALTAAKAACLLRRLGGDFHIDNDPGVGTSVVLVLPSFLP